MAREVFDDDDLPLYTVGQVADMLAVKQAFLRRVDELRVVSPQRSAGGQRRYTRVEIRVIRQVATMADEGMTMTAIRRIIELQRQLAEVIRERDEYAALLANIFAERPDLSQALKSRLRRGAGGPADDDTGSAPGPSQ